MRCRNAFVYPNQSWHTLQGYTSCLDFQSLRQQYVSDHFLGAKKVSSCCLSCLAARHIAAIFSTYTLMNLVQYNPSQLKSYVSAVSVSCHCVTAEDAYHGSPRRQPLLCAFWHLPLVFQPRASQLLHISVSTLPPAHTKEKPVHQCMLHIVSRVCLQVTSALAECGLTL